MLCARLQPRVELFQGDEDRPHFGDGVDSEMRARAVRGDAVGLDLEAGEALVRDRELQLGRLDDDRRVGPHALEHGFGADRRHLLVGDRRHDHVAAESALLGASRRVQNRGEPAFHVVRAASIHPTVLNVRLVRRIHAGNADSVEVRVQQ